MVDEDRRDGCKDNVGVVIDEDWEVPHWPAEEGGDLGRLCRNRRSKIAESRPIT